MLFDMISNMFAKVMMNVMAIVTFIFWLATCVYTVKGIQTAFSMCFQ